MSMLPINVGSSEPKIESASSSRPKREADSPNAASTNAFAATLAHAMHTPDKPAPAPKPRDANSDLDSRVSGKVSAPGTGANDGKPAFAAAAEARAAVAATPVDSASSDADALNPDFRTRLARVVSRMHEEFGKDVQLVEGFRTQSRQDFLYDQGRTRPGGVVTWTKSSKHTLGLAADVMIDGSYTDAAGFQQLAQVAAQEGLRTLGAKDPGHIELPTRGGAAAWGSSADAVNIDDNVSRAIGIALDPGNSDGRSGDSNTFGNFNGLLSRAGRGSATSSPPIQMPMMSGGGGMGSGSMSQRGFNDSQKDSTRVDDSAKVANVATVASVASVAQVAQVAHAAGLGQPQPSTLAAPVMVPTMSGTGSDAADKVGRILDARDAAPVQPLSQVTLNIDNPAGGAADQVTIQLRSGAVDTAISIGDPNRADRMSLRVGELQHALEQHGLNATAINVASTASGSGPGWNPRPGSDQSAQNGRASLNYRDNRQDADGTRHRSRRGQQGGEK